MKNQNTYSVFVEVVNTATYTVGLVMALTVCIFFLVRSSGTDSCLVPLSLNLFGDICHMVATWKMPQLFVL